MCISSDLFTPTSQKNDNLDTETTSIMTLAVAELLALVYWGITPPQQPGAYQGGELMMMKSVIWWRKPEYPEETTDLRQVTDETFQLADRPQCIIHTDLPKYDDPLKLFGGQRIITIYVFNR